MVLRLVLLALAMTASLRGAAPAPGVTRPLLEVPKDKPIVVRVLYLEDPALPTLNSAQLVELNHKIEGLLADWYGYTATLRVIGREDLATYFKQQAALFGRYATMIKAIDIEPTEKNGRERWRATIDAVLRRNRLSEIAGYLEFEHLDSHAQALEMADRLFMQRLGELRSTQDFNGRPYFDPKHRELSSFAHWCVLLKEITKADFVFTNRMVLGADADISSLNIIARGGVTTGIADANLHNPFKAAAMVGVFPFLSDAPIFLRERGQIPASELLDVIATFSMHELGHMLLRQAEHTSHEPCVHFAPRRLNYYQWHQAIRAAGYCREPHAKLTHY
jgi:hypothetical protein